MHQLTVHGEYYRANNEQTYDESQLYIDRHTPIQKVGSDCYRGH